MDQHLHIQRSQIARSQKSQAFLYFVRGREQDQEGILNLHLADWEQGVCYQFLEICYREESVIAGEGKVDFGPLESGGDVVEDPERIVKH